MKKEIKGILFDMDGVLVDSYDVWFHLLNHAAREFAYPQIDVEKCQFFYGQSVKDVIEVLYPGMKEEVIAEFFETHFFDHIDHFKTNPESIATLKALKQMRKLTCVCTNTKTPLAARILKQSGIITDYLVGSGDTPNDKPAPDILLLALERMKLKASEVIMVGDSGYDAEAAVAAGIFFVGYGRAGDASIKKLSALFDLIK